VFRVVIPARYASTRLPGKVLTPLAGRPMLQWVYEQSRKSGAGGVIVATDDERIRVVAAAFGADVVMTDASHASGTDRIAEVARNRGWRDDDIVVNVQGDEPLMPPALIDQVARLLMDHTAAGVATLSAPISAIEDFLNPNVVKVVADTQGKALYFSRAPIPWDRDGAPGELTSQSRCTGASRHIGVYGYRVGALRRLAALPPAPLEICEKLEQLRALAHGIEIRVASACVVPGPDVNTPEDVDRAAALLRS
jgi:3-deoxy-manno-octulosonate cytidylyltransferase (CMP-KDO synthetase)